MSIKTYRLCVAVVTIIVAVLAGWGVIVGYAFIPAPAVIIGAVTLYLCRKKLTKLVEDERVQVIGDHASRRTVEIAIILMAVTGSTLMALSNDDRTNLEIIGVTLGYSVCGMLVLYTVLYNYFNRKLGG